MEHTVYEYYFGVVHLSTFYCNLLEGGPVLTEHVSIKWLPPSILSSLDSAPADIPAVEKVTNNLIL